MKWKKNAFLKWVIVVGLNKLLVILAFIFIKSLPLFAFSFAILYIASIIVAWRIGLLNNKTKEMILNLLKNPRKYVPVYVYTLLEWTISIWHKVINKK